MKTSYKHQRDEKGSSKKLDNKVKMKTTNKLIKSIATVAIVFSAISFSSAQTVNVGGEAMYPSKNIVQNAVNSADHTVLVAAVKAAGLVGTLQGDGPFTVFAPVNDAFENLPSGTVESLLKPENKGKLTNILTYHVIAGEYSFKDLEKLIKKGDGTAVLKTVAGSELKFSMNGDRNILVWDARGNYANITTYDVMQSNGVIHVINKVLMP